MAASEFCSDQADRRRTVSCQFIITAAAMAFFIFMIMFNLTNSALWGDELVEYYYSQQSIRTGALYEKIILTYQPPLYNFLMHFWLRLGKSVLWFRLFSAVCGIMSGILIHAMVSGLTGRLSAAFTLVILGSAYRWVYCIQECSEYALMLLFISLALYFYIRVCESDSARHEIFFILSSVGAMYSQYGAVFVVVPILVMHFLGKCQKDRIHFLRTLVFYILSLIFFAVPLYVFFAARQTERLAENISFVVTAENIIDFPLTLGRLIAWFFNLSDYAFIRESFAAAGVIFLIVAIAELFMDKVPVTVKYLIIVLISGYFGFYWLVVFRIYGMMAGIESYGFYSRYAYFFIPLLAVAVPAVIYGAISALKSPAAAKMLTAAILFFWGMTAFAALPSVLNNWHKAYDDQFAKIWVHSGGFNDTTYLFGEISNLAFAYYTEPYTYEGSGEIVYLSSAHADAGSLPDSFWAWGTGWWSSEPWGSLVSAARDQGYEVTVYANVYETGELAYCHKEE